jgi:hypothetical protein
MTKNIIVNADDFGSKSSVNKAIAELFNTGAINSTTLIANMAGFDEAVELANKNNFITKIGVHLNLSAGDPLTLNILNTNLFFNKNDFVLKKHKTHLFFLTKDDKKLIFKEFAAWPSDRNPHFSCFPYQHFNVSLFQVFQILLWFMPDDCRYGP